MIELLDEHERPDDQVLLEAILEQGFNSVVITDARFDRGGPLIERCNPAFCRMTGYEAEELIGRSPRILQGPDTDPAVIDELRTCLHEGRFFQGSTVNYRKDGTPYHLEWNISPIRDRHGIIRHFVSVQQNITARVLAERERDLLARALHEARDPILVTDAEARIVFSNRAFERLSGYPSEHILGQTPRFLQSGEHSAEFYQDLRETLARGESFRATFANRNRSGTRFYADQSITPIIDAAGKTQNFIGISKDITQTIAQQQQLSEEAARDGLTGLLNRRAGERILDRAHRQALQQERSFAVLMADIDHFKQVNDQLGHASGDRILKSIAAILENNIRERDHAVRWGGEEFLVILDQACSDVARTTAERIRAAAESRPDPEARRITLSLGHGQWQPGESIIDLLQRVDAALYAAKHRGRNQVVAATLSR